MDQKKMNFEMSFDIRKVSFDNVSPEFEKKFRESYSNSLQKMADSEDRITNASGVNNLGILEKMASRIEDYDKSSRFEDSYRELQEEYERFTET